MSTTHSFTIPHTVAESRKQERINNLLAELFTDDNIAEVDETIRQVVKEILDTKAGTRVHVIIDDSNTSQISEDSDSENVDDEEAEWLDHSRRRLQEWMTQNEY